MINIEDGVVKTAQPGLESPVSEVVKRVIEAQLRQASITQQASQPNVYALVPSLEYKGAVRIFPTSELGVTKILLLMRDSRLFTLRTAYLTQSPDGEVVAFDFPPQATGSDVDDILRILASIQGGQKVSDRPYSMPHLPE